MARSRNTSLDNALAYAVREARKLGGDAIVDVVPSEAAGGNGQLMLIASVARWE